MESRDVAVNETIPTVISCDNLDEAIEQYKKRGYRLDMIRPADAPREALLSEPPAVAGGLSWAGDSNESDVRHHSVLLKLHPSRVRPPANAAGSDWIAGRAGMEYRDLIPGRLGGKVIASHIRLMKGGEVPDYVHYHKVDFQMIYCKRGRIRVVYEEQGPPFWLESGDCILQPPKIRHRVLECTAGAEVIEVSMPAEHETWVEHAIELPTAELDREKDFGGQRFARHIAAEVVWERSEFDGFDERRTRILEATDGAADVRVLRPTHADAVLKADQYLVFPLDQGEILTVNFVVGGITQNHRRTDGKT